MTVNNHPVPGSLIEFQQSFRSIKNEILIHDLLKKSDPAYLLTIYGSETIQKETKNLLRIFEVQTLNLNNEAYNFFKNEMYYFGYESEVFFPGTLDMRKAIIIGDFAPDVPIALDYRFGESTPIVTYLNADLAWEKVADSYDDFIKVIEPYDHL